MVSSLSLAESAARTGFVSLPAFLENPSAKDEQEYEKKEGNQPQEAWPRTQGASSKGELGTAASSWRETRNGGTGEESSWEKPGASALGLLVWATWKRTQSWGWDRTGRVG